MSDDDTSQNEPTTQQPLVQTLSKEGRWILLAQLVPAVVGIFIGCLALYAALSEADAVRKQQQAAVWPYAEVTDNRTINLNAIAYEVRITNKGIGPARVKSFTASVDGKEYTDWETLLNAVSSQEPRPIFYSQGTISRKVLSPGESISIVGISYTTADTPEGEAPDETSAFYNKLIEDFATGRENGRVVIKYCYCSVFDECWRVEERRQEPVPIDACPVPTAAFPL